MSVLINQYGSPVTGDKHFNRVIEKRQLLDRAQNGQHTNLAAARRTGKTSLMRETLNALRTQGWAAIEIDFSKCHTMESFFADFEQAIENHLKQHESVMASGVAAIMQPLKNLAKRSFKFSVPEIASIEIGQSADKQADANSVVHLSNALSKVLNEIAQASPAKKLVLGIDELTVFFHHYLKNTTDEEHTTRLADIEVLLYMLRTLRQQPDMHCFWLHCSSIGLDGFVERHKMTHALSGLTAYHLEPFSEIDTRAMLQALWLGKQQSGDFPEAAATQIIQRLTWLMPFFTQMLFGVLMDLRERAQTSAPPNAQDVDAAYQELLSVKYNKEFKHWHDRLDELLRPADAKIVKCLLGAACKKPKGISRSKLFDAVAMAHSNLDLTELETTVRDLLNTLERDGYLERIHKKGAPSQDYTFRSPLLRDYWNAHCQAISPRRAPRKSK